MGYSVTVVRKEYDIIRASHLVHRFQAARRNPSLAVLEGFHPLKHALRYNADVQWVVAVDLDVIEKFCQALAPDVANAIREQAVVVDASTFRQLAPVPPRTGVISLAQRPRVATSALLRADRQAPLVVLERPADLGNMGATIRVAASAGAHGVVSTGPQDPWHPASIRGAAGLQYALPVARVEALPRGIGPLFAIHPEGESLVPGAIPSDAVLVFGSERRGLSGELLSQVDRRIAIPMEPGVSSLNLATSVAVVLYTWRLSQGGNTN